MDAGWAEVRALETEIAELQRACKKLPAPHVPKSFEKILPSDSKEWESSKALKNQLEHLEVELSFLGSLTGLNVRNYSKKTKDLTNAEMIEKGIKKVMQSHRLSGNCRMVSFQLEFQILEIETKENSSSMITDLNIIMEPTEYSELSEFVCRVEERRDLLMFFRSLHFFMEWYEHRKNTFKYFKDKYPDTVHLSEGPSSHCMEIRSASQPGFELMVVWRIQIDEEGKVLPKLDLLTKVPHRALQLDKRKVIETAPLNFRALLGTLGIEAALQSLINCFV
ncbi:centromere protein P [Thomomys bottae]